MKITFLLLILISTYSNGCDLDESCFKTLWENALIVPDLIPKAPPTLLNIIFPNCIDISPGKLITAQLGQYEPSVLWQFNKTKLYTFMLFDPIDEHHLPAKHWLVINVPWNNLYMGDVVAEYFGIIPKHNFGIHQFVVLVFEQQQKLPFNGTTGHRRSNFNRTSWDYLGFIRDNNLGDPVAGNFFYGLWSQVQIQIIPYLTTQNDTLA